MAYYLSPIDDLPIPFSFIHRVLNSLGIKNIKSMLTICNSTQRICRPNVTHSAPPNRRLEYEAVDKEITLKYNSSPEAS